jgi:hypothetical protein
MMLISSCRKDTNNTNGSPIHLTSPLMGDSSLFTAVPVAWQTAGISGPFTVYLFSISSSGSAYTLLDSHTTTDTFFTFHDTLTYGTSYLCFVKAGSVLSDTVCFTASYPDQLVVGDYLVTRSYTSYGPPPGGSYNSVVSNDTINVFVDHPGLLKIKDHNYTSHSADFATITYPSPFVVVYANTSNLLEVRQFRFMGDSIDAGDEYSTMTNGYSYRWNGRRIH